MKISIKLISGLVIAFFLLFTTVNIFPQDNSKNAEGNWLGSLKVSGISLRIVFHISKTEDGNYKATMDSPDQGAKDIPVEKVSVNGDSIEIEMPQLRGEYKGRFDDEGTSIEGTWSQAGSNFPLNLEKTNKPVVINRPQEPKPPFPYNSEDVSYVNIQEGNTLAGTFTFPKEGGPFPAVLLITGSGPQNRDEELLGHKPFLVLSDYLTRRGIAVLRVDDRGVGKSTGNFAGATSADFATDVLAGVEYLKTRKEVNKNEIGLIGHSEGGLIAPMVAVKSKDVAFIVLMAGPGVPGDSILIMQEALISAAEGSSPDVVAKGREVNREIYDIIKNEPDSVKAHNEVVNIFEIYYDSLPDSVKTKVGDKNTALKMLERIETPWFRFFLRYDPRPTLEKVKCPVLAIDGSKDLQVPPKEDLEAIAKALKKGGNKNFKTVELKGLNHLFQDCNTGSPAEYNTIEETISPTALKTIGDWVLKITK
ncbi:MAG: alpha/beta hydrolase [Ignavibacteriaceae bacterium]